MILFILSICALSILVLVLIPVVASVNHQKDKVLSLFCDIDDSTITRLSLRCEKFLNKLDTQDNNEGDMESNEDLMETTAKNEDEDEYGSTGMIGAKKSKRAKNNTKTNKWFYVKFMLAILVIEAYFSYNFGTFRDYTKTTQVQVNELNLTATVEPFFQFTKNTIREMFYNQSKPVLQ